MTYLSEWLNKNYPPIGFKPNPVVKDIESLWEQFQPYADPHFINELCSNDVKKFYQRHWEMSLCCSLLNKGLKIISNSGKGPDIVVECNTHRIFIEAISPTPGTGHNRIPHLTPEAQSSPVPVQEILLRWTAAFKVKAEKFMLYISHGLINDNDHCVIAINSSQLGHHGFHGISQYPVAIETVYPIGAMQAHFSPDNTQSATYDHLYRPAIKNANQKEITTRPFLDDQYSRVSAVLATHRDAYWRLGGNAEPLVLVHNLKANPKLPLKSIPADHEIWPEDLQNGQVTLHFDPPLSH